MKNSFGVLTMIALAVMVSGCAGVEIGKAERADSMGSAFNQALYTEYLERSGVEYAEGDYENSDLFAIKAQRAAADELVVPEQVEDHALPEDIVGAIIVGREQLVEALADGGRTEVPDIAARAQRMFDCWVEEQEENRQPDDILACQDAFWDELRKMQEAIKKPEPMVMAPEPEPMPEPEPEPEPMEAPTMPVLFVLFDFDSASLDAKAVSLVENIAAQILARNPTRVFVSGHTDSSGSDDYNEALSERRAQTVASALTSLGVDGSILIVTAMSEYEQRVETDDGVRERQNRYVRVTLIP